MKNWNACGATLGHLSLEGNLPKYLNIPAVRGSIEAVGCSGSAGFLQILIRGWFLDRARMVIVGGYQVMRSNLFRRLILSMLIFTLLLPAGELAALAQSSKDKQAPAPQPQQTPGFSISVTVPVVSVDVVVTDNDGNYLTDLKKENFRLTEDGTVQTITNFGASEAPITIVLLLEFSKLGYQVFSYNARNWTPAFLANLKPNDWVALETFNMRPSVEVDFTHNRDEVMQGLYQLVFPPFSESNLFDAVSDVLDRIKDVKGKKSVLVLASGIDTFSRMTLDQTMKRIRETDATIFTIGVGEQLFCMPDARGGLGRRRRI